MRKDKIKGQNIEKPTEMCDQMLTKTIAFLIKILA